MSNPAGNPPIRGGEDLYTAHALADGFPATTDTHGGFGWSSVWLLQNNKHRVIMDTGPTSYIPLLHRGLSALGLEPSDITDVVISHLHWDHMSNFTMFPQARVWAGQSELQWASRLPSGTPFVSDLHIHALTGHGRELGPIRGGQEFLVGLHAVDTPGHTPGHLSFLAETVDGPLLFAGDAAKNLFEVNSLRAESTMDQQSSTASLQRLRGIMQDTTAILVPGHDVPLHLEGLRVVRSRSQEAQISFFNSEALMPEDRSIASTLPASGAARIPPPERELSLYSHSSNFGDEE